MSPLEESQVCDVPEDLRHILMECVHNATFRTDECTAGVDTEMLYKLGRAAMEEGKYGEAIKKFVETLKLYDNTLSPPYRSYYDCVQDLRRSMLSLGNYSIV